VSTYIVNQGEIENEILRLSDLLEAQTHEYGQALNARAVAEADYRVQYARSFTKYRFEKLSEETSKQKATDEVGHLLVLRLSAEAKERFLEEQCRSLRAQLDAVRTLSANVRAQT
jgi:hypothetical protein